MHSSQALLAYIGLGSNLNQPNCQLNAAVTALRQTPQIDLVALSHFYQTKPVGSINQPDFINAVIALKTPLSADDLLLTLQQLEQHSGRVRDTDKNGPRSLDLDILLYGNQIISSQQLTVPHPRMLQRAFVLVPLAEIAPNLILPDGKSLMDYLLALGDTSLLVTRIE